MKNRWNEVKGTYLCYTAIPQSPATDICCDIATYLAEQNGDKALSYLLPSVKHTCHPFIYDNMADHDIRHLVRSCILSDDNSYLIPVDLLATLTCRSRDDDLTTVLNETLRYPDANRNPRHLTTHEQQRLINHSALTQKLVGARQGFETAQQSEQSLSTMLGDLEQAFRRASRGNIEGATEDEAGQSATEGLMTFRNRCNLLANMDLILTQQAPNQSEANHAFKSNPRRVYLIKTAPSTYQMGFQNSEGQYQQQKLSRDEATGSGYLIDALDHIPDEHFNGEPYTGTLLSKPQIGYIIGQTGASHVFKNDFFTQQFYKDHLVNPINRAFYDYGYCVAQQAESLKHLLLDHKDDLLCIKPDGTLKKTLSNQYSSQFNEYYHELNDKIYKDSYEGQDPLRLTREQIHSIHPDYINHRDDVLFILEGLTPDEIETATRIFDQQMRRALTDISDLAVVLSGLNSEQIERFISSLNGLSNIIKKPDLPNLVRFLPDDKAGAFLKAAGTQFIENKFDLKNTLEALDPNLHEQLLNSLAQEKRLTSMIKSPYDLKTTLEVLDPNRQEQLLNSLAQEKRLTSMIENPYYLKTTLEVLDQNWQEYLLNNLAQEKRLTSMIKNPLYLKTTLEALGQNWQKHLLNKLAQNCNEYQNKPRDTVGNEASLAFGIMKSNSIPRALYPTALTEFINTAKYLSGDNFKQSSYSRNQLPEAAINWVETTVAKHFFQCWSKLLNTTDEQVDTSEIAQSELAKLKNELSDIKDQFNSNNRTQEASSATSLQSHSLFAPGNNTNETSSIDELASWLESVLQDYQANAQTAVKPT